MKIDWQRLASIGICVTILAALLFLLGKYVAAVFLPFILAWLMAFFANYIGNGVCALTRLPRRLCVVLSLLLLYFLIVGLLYLGINRSISEIENLISRITKEGGGVYESISGFALEVGRLGARIPRLGEVGNAEKISAVSDKINELIIVFLKGLASDLGTLLSSLAAATVKTLPSTLLFIVISIVASFYFALDFKEINDWLVSVSPRALQKRLPLFKARTKSLALRYLKAYSLLMLLTFAELFVGLSILKADYALLLALGISLLDVLPILGTGTVLIPWAVFSFFSHDFGFGIGLIAIWATVTVVRQITEPRIVGSTIGLHPAVTLIGMYVGFKLFGIIGMLLAPAAIIGARSYLPNKAIIEPPIDRVAKK